MSSLNIPSDDLRPTYFFHFFIYHIFIKFGVLIFVKKISQDTF